MPNKDRPKFIQITVSTGAGEDSPDILYALDSSGGVWRFLFSMDGQHNEESWEPLNDDRIND
jgi:hypothetical protein